MEIKVTFRFDASESLLAACDNFRKAMEAMSALGGLSSLPVSKEAGIVKAVATEDGVTMNKKEQIWPPKSGGAVPSEVSASPATPTAPGGDSDGGAVTYGEQPPAGKAPAAPTPTVVVETAPAGSTVPSVADMRKAVNNLRVRVEGADWEDKSSEGYKLYHKKVTSAVKGVVAFCGAEKLPDIPEDKRQSFIAQVDGLGLEDGEVKPVMPF